MQPAGTRTVGIFLDDTKTQNRERSESLTSSKQIAITILNNLMLRGLAPQKSYDRVSWGRVKRRNDYYGYRDVTFEWTGSESGNFEGVKITLSIEQKNNPEDGSKKNLWWLLNSVVIEQISNETVTGKITLDGHYASRIQHTDTNASLLS